MAQPLPNSLIALETNRIILNERIMPGITKILLIAKDFPQLNIRPGSTDIKDTQKMNIIHQVSQVFVFEDEHDKEGDTNGTLKLIYKMKEHLTPDLEIMHAIRKEFLKKVLVGYIKQIPVGKKEQDVHELYAEDGFGITTVEQRKEVK